MRKSDFSDVLAKARAAQAAGDPSLALQQLSSFIDVQKPILVSRHMSRVVTEPFLPVILLHNELAISLHEILASRQSLNHYRKLFSFSAPFTVDQAFRDYIKRIQNTLDEVGPDFDSSTLAPLGGSNERNTSLFIIQTADLHNYPPQARTVIFAFLALRMIIDILRCTTMVGLYKDALDAFFLLCGRFNRKQEFAMVTERVLSGFIEPIFKSDLTVAVEYLKDRSLVDAGEADSDLGTGVGKKSPECEYTKPNTLVASIYCKLTCIPLCHTFGLPTLAVKLLESSAADILLLTNSVPRACVSLYKLSCDYPIVEETPALIELIANQSIMQVYSGVNKEDPGACSSIQHLTVSSTSTLSKEKGPDNVIQLRTGPSIAANDGVGTKGGASPATLNDLNAVIAAHLRAAISVFSSEGYLFAASILRYKAVKVIPSLDPQVKETLLNEAFAALLSLRQDSLYSSVVMNYANMFRSTRSTNPSFLLNRSNISHLTPASMVTSNAFCFDKQVHAISLENNPVYQCRNLANRNSFATISGTITSTSILDSVLQDIVASYSSHLHKGLLDLLPLLYSEEDLLITTTAKAFVVKATECLLQLYDKWSLGESCVHLQEALAKKAISLMCIERAHDALMSHIKNGQERTLDIMNALTTQVALDDIMAGLEDLFAGKLTNDELYRHEFVQQTILDALRSKVFTGHYDFVSKTVSILTYATVSSFYLNKVDTCFITTTLRSVPGAESKVSNLTKKLSTAAHNKLAVAQLIVMRSLLDICDSKCIEQRSTKLNQAQSSAQMRRSKIQEAYKAEQKRLQEYKEAVIQRQERDEKLDLEARKKQREAKRAIEIRQIQIRMAKQFIDDVAIKLHDTELINYLTSFDLENMPDPHDQIKRVHHQFEIARANKKLERDIRTSNLAELTLYAIIEGATDRLMKLDRIENDYLQPRLKQIHEVSQNYEKEKHMKNLEELELYNNVPGLNEFVESYMNDCRQVYNDIHANWKAERDKVLEEIQKEVKEKQNAKTERMNNLMNRAKAKLQNQKVNPAAKPEQGTGSTNSSRPEEKNAQQPVKSYADKFLGRK